MYIMLDSQRNQVVRPDNPTFDTPESAIEYLEQQNLGPSGYVIYDLTWVWGDDNSD